MSGKKYNVFKYDRNGRMVAAYGHALDILFAYKYARGGRTTTIANPKNRSNYKTVQEERIEGDSFIPVIRQEFGTVYDTVIRFDRKGREIFLERVNKIKKTILKISIFWCDREKNKIWIQDYNGEKSVGFTVHRKKIALFKKMLK